MISSRSFSIVIPVHRRHLVSARVIAYYKRTQPEIPVLTVGGTLDVRGDFHVVSPNEPLGAKFNAGVHAAHKLYGADHVCVIGSDSYIHPDYFDAVRAMDTTYPYMNTNGVHFWYPDAMYLDRRFRSGSGVFLSRVLLDRCDGRPYDQAGVRNLDAGPRKHAGCGGIYEFREPWVLEDRSGENMWSREWVENLPLVEQVDPIPVLESFGV